MLNRVRLYFIYRKIKKRGWPKFKNFREYLKRRNWCLNYTPEDYKKYIECDYETPN